jgi:hypothetical protein
LRAGAVKTPELFLTMLGGIVERSGEAGVRFTPLDALFGSADRKKGQGDEAVATLAPRCR